MWDIRRPLAEGGRGRLRGESPTRGIGDCGGRLENASGLALRRKDGGVTGGLALDLEALAIGGGSGGGTSSMSTSMTSCEYRRSGDEANGR